MEKKTTTHATTLVLYQSNTPVRGSFAAQRSSSSNRASSITDDHIHTLEYFSAVDRQPMPLDSMRNFSSDLFTAANRNIACRNPYSALMLCRLCPQKLFEINLDSKIR